MSKLDSVQHNTALRPYDAAHSVVSRDKRGAWSDYRRFLAMAVPLILSESVGVIFQITDTWFVSGISSEATAAMAAAVWLNLSASLLLGGTVLSVQTFAAQAFGAGRLEDASQAAWSGMFVILLLIPFFIALGFAFEPLLSVIGIDPKVRVLAEIYWWPSFVVAGPLLLVGKSLSKFFTSTEQARRTLAMTITTGVVNLFGNIIFVSFLHCGIAGSGWAAVFAAAASIVLGFMFFLDRSSRKHFQSHRTWRRPNLIRTFMFGLPLGLGRAADFSGFSLIMLMAVKLGAAEGASAQIVATVNATCYVISIGLSGAGATLVGQAVGRHDNQYAKQLGNLTLALILLSCIGFGFAVTFAMPWLGEFFLSPEDPLAEKTLTLCLATIGIAATFQIVDGAALTLNGFLATAGDVRTPALLTTGAAWLVWVPLAHMLIFAPDQGWVSFLPQFGLGLSGLWWASIVYAITLCVILLPRWLNGTWEPMPS